MRFKLTVSESGFTVNRVPKSEVVAVADIVN